MSHRLAAKPAITMLRFLFIIDSSSLLSLSAALPGVFRKPAQHHTGDLHIVLFKHHHVAVAADTDISEFDPDGTHTGLFEIFHGAMIIRRVIRRFCRDDES